MNNYDILAISACFFVDKDGEKVKYYRAIVREYGDDKDIITVEKSTGGFYEKYVELCPLKGCTPLYDRHGRISAITDLYD